MNTDFTARMEAAEARYQAEMDAAALEAARETDATEQQPLPRRRRVRFAQWHPGAALLRAHERAVIVPILRAFWQGTPLTKAQRRVVRGWK